MSKTKTLCRCETSLRTEEDPLVFLAPLELYVKKTLFVVTSHVCSSMRGEKLLSPTTPNILGTTIPNWPAGNILYGGFSTKIQD